MALISIKNASDPARRPPARSRGLRHPRARRIAAWARGPTFARDIAIVLIVKLALLIALKLAFFNHPQAEHMSLPPAAVAEKLLSVPAPVSSGVHHDQ